MVEQVVVALEHVITLHRLLPLLELPILEVAVVEDLLTLKHLLLLLEAQV
jgi:hypothetical protein